MACRDMSKCQQARDDIMADTPTPTGSILCRECDLADFESIQKFAANFKKEESRLDVLINNGGVLWGPRTTTKQGIEMQLEVHHVGHFLLTKLLLNTLKNSAPSRVAVVSSVSHTTGKIKFEDLNSEKLYGEMACYDQIKLANVVFVKQLAKNLEDMGVVVNALHPEVVATEIWRNSRWTNNFAGKFLLKTFFKTPTQGAATTLHVALDPSLVNVTGKYFRGKYIVTAKK